jgi:adenylate cyclase
MAEERTQRRLAAIMAADAAGYSRLMGLDEEGTLATLKSHRQLIDGLIADHAGRVFGSAGDSIIAEFASPVEAVRCATRTQLELEQRNIDLPEAKRICFRIGINLGDVIVEGGDLYGDGVNIAAWIEGLADPGSVYVSQTVFSHVQAKVSLRFEDLGERSLKNMAEPVPVYRVSGSVASGGDVAPIKVGSSSKPSIAVLPFNNMSADQEQAYFSDGITEDILTALSRFNSLFVIARHSSFEYRDRAIDVRRAGRQLGVRYIVEGSDEPDML